MQDNGNLSAAIEALEVERNKVAQRLKGIDDALALLRDITAPSQPPTASAQRGGNPVAKNGGADPLKDPRLAIHEAAAMILEREGEPMKANLIATRLERSSYPYEEDSKTLQRSVASALARHCDKDTDPFVRIGHGVYGLRKWRESESPSDGATAERPGNPERESKPNPVGSAEREKEDSNPSLPLSERL